MSRDAKVLSELLLLSPLLGALSETFIARHCEDLAPGRTCFAAFEEVRASPSWPADRVLLMPSDHRPRASLFSRVRSRLEPPSRRRLYGDVWWVGDDGLSRLAAHVAKHNPQVALLEYLDRWLDAIPLLVEAGMRVVVHGHGYDLSVALRRPAAVRAYRELLPQAHAVVVPSHHAAAQLRRIGLDNVSVIPYGIPPGPREARRRTDATSTHAVAVGRLVPKKDPVGLVRAVAQARSDGAEIELDLYGDGPLRSRVEQKVRRLKAGSFVRLHGAQPNATVREAMNAADLFVQRSVTGPNGDEEGLPLAILEAMASGLPIASTVHAGIPEAVVDRQTGLLATEDDLAGFVFNLGTYARNPEMRLEHGIAGRTRFLDQFTWARNRTRLRATLQLAHDDVAIDGP